MNKQRPRKQFESGGALAKRALLHITKIKRFYVVHEPNENFWKYGVSITSEMAFTESLILRKGHFRSSNGGGHMGGGTCPHCPRLRGRCTILII